MENYLVFLKEVRIIRGVRGFRFLIFSLHKKRGVSLIFLFFSLLFYLILNEPNKIIYLINGNKKLFSEKKIVKIF